MPLPAGQGASAPEVRCGAHRCPGRPRALIDNAPRGNASERFLTLRPRSPPLLCPRYAWGTCLRLQRSPGTGIPVRLSPAIRPTDRRGLDQRGAGLRPAPGDRESGDSGRYPLLHRRAFAESGVAKRRSSEMVNPANELHPQPCGPAQDTDVDIAVDAPGRAPRLGLGWRAEARAPLPPGRRRIQERARELAVLEGTPDWWQADPRVARRGRPLAARALFLLRRLGRQTRYAFPAERRAWWASADRSSVELPAADGRGNSRRRSLCGKRRLSPPAELTPRRCDWRRLRRGWPAAGRREHRDRGDGRTQPQRS